MLAGAGVDYSRISSAEGEMKTVVDNTVYNPSMSFHNRPAAEAYIADMINANSGRNTAEVKISINQNKMRIEARDKIDTPLLGVIDRDTSPIVVVAELDSPTFEGSTKVGETVGETLSPSQKVKMRKALRKVELGLEKAVQRAKTQRFGNVSQRRQLRRFLERQLNEVRRQIRNQG